MHTAVSVESRNYVADILTLKASISGQRKIYLTDTLVYHFWNLLEKSFVVADTWSWNELPAALRLITETSIVMLNLETHLIALAHKKIVFFVMQYYARYI